MKGGHLVLLHFYKQKIAPWESDFLRKNVFLITDVICYMSNHNFLLFSS